MRALRRVVPRSGIMSASIQARVEFAASPERTLTIEDIDENEYDEVRLYETAKACSSSGSLLSSCVRT